MPGSRAFVATGLLFDEQHRILLLKRSTNSSHFTHYWQLPEGKIEFGEQPRRALEREINEELGVSVRSAQLVDIVSTVGTGKYMGKEIIRAVYTVKLKRYKSLQLSFEHSDFRWVDIETIPEEWLLVPGTVTLIMLAKKERIRNSGGTTLYWP